MSRLIGFCFVALLALAQMAPAALVCCLNTVCLGQTSAVTTAVDHDSCCAKKEQAQIETEGQQCSLLGFLSNTHWLPQSHDNQILEVHPGHSFLHQIKIPLVLESAPTTVLHEYYSRPADSPADQSLRLLRSTQLLI